MRQRFVCWAAGILSVLTVVGAEDPKRPNIVLLIGEAQGWSSLSRPMDPGDPSSGGVGIFTPHLDRLASEGTRFTRFRAASPRCTPTRVALLTGRNPARLHMTFVGEGRRDMAEIPSRVRPVRTISDLPLSENTLAESLRNAGYRTAHFGKWHMGRTDPSHHGFDESTGPTSNGGPEEVANPNPKQAQESARLGVEFIRKCLAEGRPFFLQVAQYAGRSALDATPEGLSEVRRRMGQRNLPNQASMAVAEDADRTYGLLFRCLEEAGAMDRTIVVYTSDHGAPGRNPPWSSGKGTLGEGGLRVPLLVRGPGIRAGHVEATPASSMDVAPTILELVGVKVPAGDRNLFDGDSLAPLLRKGGAEPFHRRREGQVVHFPHADKDSEGPGTAFVLGDEKLIHRLEKDRWQLYDLASDPREVRDLGPDRPARVAQLRAMLEERLVEMGAEIPVLDDGTPPARPSAAARRRGSPPARRRAVQP